MGKFRLFEDEELVARFRPHPMSYGRRYLWSLAWAIPGGLGAATSLFVGGDHAIAWGLVALALSGLLAGLIHARMMKTRTRFPWFAAAIGFGGVVVDLLGVPFWPFEAVLLPLAVGMGLALVRLVGWELERMSRLQFLTTERLVLRTGVGSRHERTVQLKRVQEIRSEHGYLGQAFDYGNLILVMGRHVRGTEAKVFEEHEALRGIGRLGEIKHQVEQLVEETKLPQKDRRRRVDERRVKESMRVLARWMRRGQRSRP